MFTDRTLKEVVDGLAPVFANLGIGVTMDSQVYGGGRLDYLVLEFDWEKLSLPPEAAWIKNMIARKLGVAIGFSEDIMVGTFGPNCIVRAKEVLDRTPGLDPADYFNLGAVASEYWFVFRLTGRQFVDALMEIKVVADNIGHEPWLAGLKDCQGLFAYAGKRERGLWANPGSM